LQVNIKRDDKGIHLKNKKMFIITSESTCALIKNVYPNILTDENIAERKIHKYNESS
jgi:thioredoxin-related protein